MSRDTPQRLNDILEAILRARLADERLRLAEMSDDAIGVQIAFEAILHNFFVIGEAVKALPEDLRSRAPEIPWSDIAAMRDVIGHHYHRIVPSIIHATIEHDLGPLEMAVARLRG